MSNVDNVGTISFTSVLNYPNLLLYYLMKMRHAAPHFMGIKYKGCGLCKNQL